MGKYFIVICMVFLYPCYANAGGMSSEDQSPPQSERQPGGAPSGGVSGTEGVYGGQYPAQPAIPNLEAVPQSQPQTVESPPTVTQPNEISQPDKLKKGAVTIGCNCNGKVRFGATKRSNVCASGGEQAVPCSGQCPGGERPWASICQ